MSKPNAHPSTRGGVFLYPSRAMGCGSSRHRSRAWLALAAALFGAALLGRSAADASAARRPQRRRATPTRTPTPAPTPTQTPIPVYRAAGFCLRYERDHFLVLAELGQAGRVFRIDKTTVIAAKVATGVRLRILFVDTPEGPLARRITPGPTDPTPTPGK